MYLLSIEGNSKYLKMFLWKSHIYSQLLPQLKKSLDFSSFHFELWIPNWLSGVPPEEQAQK